MVCLPEPNQRRCQVRTEEQELLLYMASLIKNSIPKILEMIAEMVVAIGDTDLQISTLAKIEVMKMAVEQEQGTLLTEEE